MARCPYDKREPAYLAVSYNLIIINYRLSTGSLWSPAVHEPHGPPDWADSTATQSAHPEAKIPGFYDNRGVVVNLNLVQIVSFVVDAEASTRPRQRSERHQPHNQQQYQRLHLWGHHQSWIHNQM